MEGHLESRSIEIERRKLAQVLFFIFQLNMTTAFRKKL